ncbi:Hypothetical protein DEACI_2195 [Acididesulfobacillus acetoxydans]|uniref:Uncharacterized protein n=1 Tax=Acididesulfobacillus acetoxydans TaxID=1561005 RepID=A0A8S0W3C4_9FIRM|nr:Hypothetical protein DEACI_2195 [Acididesulfobacillus acetoxydans]CEJ07015.1 Hypothetical protein DEACI_1469 [Acididesulfobacillus acetoxydans]
MLEMASPTPCLSIRSIGESASLGSPVRKLLGSTCVSKVSPREGLCIRIEAYAEIRKYGRFDPVKKNRFLAKRKRG